jgi:hypothetical protein
VGKRIPGAGAGGAGRRRRRFLALALALCGSLLLSVASAPAQRSFASGRSRATASSNAKHGNKPKRTSKPRRGGRPVVEGSAIDGSVLTANPGTWKGTAPFTFGYQWSVCVRRRKCSPISGATQSTYRATTSNIGEQLRVRVTATNSAGSASSSSLDSAKVSAGQPVDLEAPSISGTPAYGQTLTASAGTWAGTPPLAFAYQWLSCQAAGGACGEIAGATEPTYTVTPTDTGKDLQVLVSAASPYGSASAASEPVAVASAAPADSALPSISGTTAEGHLLTASTGTWSGTEPILYGYQWQLCNATGGECANILGAILPTLLLGEEDIDHALRATVTASNIAGSSTATSEPSAVVEAVPPSSVVGPSIAGLPIVAQTLTAVNGLWSGSSPITYAYQWERCNGAGEDCSEIASATKSSYLLTDEDAGSTIRVLVTAANAGGSTSVTSGATSQIFGVSPTNTTPPSVGGTPEAGQLLTASSGTWSGTEPVLYGYQWQLCNATGGECANILGASLPTLLLGEEDIGHTLRVLVTASNIAGSSTATSEPSALVKAIPPTSVLAPSIVGLTIVGQTLTAVNGLWSGTQPITYTYRWQLCNSLGEACSNLESATNPSYEIPAGEVGETIRVVVTASNGGGTTPATSAATLAISGAPPSNTARPTIGGETRAGQLLTGSGGTWSGTEPVLYGYQWQLCNATGGECANILGAILPTLLLGEEDIGHTLRVTVTASNIAGSSTATSEPSALVKAVPPTDVILPTISGLPITGQTLTAVNGLWSGTQPITYTYQWQRCNTLGEACSNLTGATKSTYVLTGADAGHAVRVVVTAKNAGGSSSATSLASLITL